MCTESLRQLVEKSCKMVSPRHIPEPWNKSVTAVITFAITLIIACSYVLCTNLIYVWLYWGIQSAEKHSHSKGAQTAVWRMVSFPLLVL